MREKQELQTVWVLSLQSSHVHRLPCRAIAQLMGNCRNTIGGEFVGEKEIEERKRKREKREGRKRKRRGNEGGRGKRARKREGIRVRILCSVLDKGHNVG